MEFQEKNGILTSGTEEFLTFCVNQTVEGNTSQTVEPSVTDIQTNMSDLQSSWISVDDLSECAAAFTEFKTHFQYILSYPDVELPDDLDNVHRTYSLLNDDDYEDIDDDDCPCIHDQSISLPCHLDYVYEHAEEYSNLKFFGRECLEAIDDAWTTQYCYEDTLELSSSLIQAKSFAEALCYAQEIRNVIKQCLNPSAKDLDATLRRVCEWTRNVKKKATRNKDHLLKVEDSARRAEPLLIRWRDHVLDIGIHNSFSLQVIIVNFYRLFRHGQF